MGKTPPMVAHMALVIFIVMTAWFLPFGRWNILGVFAPALNIPHVLAGPAPCKNGRR